MANPIAFNNGNTPAGSIKRATVSVGISGQDYSGLGGLTWYAGIEPAGKYIIYSDTYSQGSSTLGNAKPTAWGTDNLFSLINSLPERQGQTPFETLAAATDWLIGTGKYIIVNDYQPNIVTDGLTLNLDSSLTTSYPSAGTNWYDTSPTSSTTVLTNGPNFSGYGFSLDGTDDGVATGRGFTSLGMGNSSYTAEITYYRDENNNADRTLFGVSAGGTGYGLHLIIRSNQPYFGHYSADSSSGYYTITGTYHVVFVFEKTGDMIGTQKIYINGELKSTSTSKSALYDVDNYKVGIGGFSYWGHFNGSIYLARIYNRALSNTELKQNYYQGNIVTNGLTFNFDSSNFVSYRRTGTSAFDMVSGTSGTLTNGPEYSFSDSNGIYFDGTNDYAEWGRVSGTEFQYSDSFAIEVWYKPNGNTGYVFTNRKGTSLAYSGWAIYQNSSGYIQCWIGGYPNAYGWKRVYAYTQNNTWVHVVYVNTPAAGSQKIYVNGVNAGFNANEDAAYQSSYIDYTATPYHVPVLGTSPADGYTQNSQFTIGVARVYNVALTEGQANQNFNAQRMRFGL